MNDKKTASLKIKRLAADIDADLHRRIKIRAAEEGVGVKAIIVRGLTDYLNRSEKEPRRG